MVEPESESATPVLLPTMADFILKSKIEEAERDLAAARQRFALCQRNYQSAASGLAVAETRHKAFTELLETYEAPIVSAETEKE